MSLPRVLNIGADIVLAVVERIQIALTVGDRPSNYEIRERQPGVRTVERQTRPRRGTLLVIQHRMDQVRSETDLVGAANQTEIIGELRDSGVRVAGHSWIGVNGECRRNTDARNFCQPLRVVDVFYSQVGE